MLRRRTTQVFGLLAAATALVALAALPLAAGLVVVNPNATVIVSDLSPVQGQTITVNNAANSDSTCIGGVAVVFVEGLPPGILSQRVDTPDVNGNWQVTVYFPFASEWPSNYVLGPFQLLANCFAVSGTEVTTQNTPEFAYVPVDVALEEPDPTPEPTTPTPTTPPTTASSPTTSTTAPGTTTSTTTPGGTTPSATAATAVPVQPTFTG